MNTLNAIMKINLRQTKAAYIAVGVCLAAQSVQAIVLAIVADIYTNNMPLGNYMYLLPLLMAILIPARNFTKLINLGGKRMDFFKGSLLTYAAVVLFTTLLTILSYYTLNRLAIIGAEENIGMDLLDVFGFMARGPVVAFLQMLAFLFLFVAVAHTLTLVQGRWYGWVVDVLIIAVISVFTPIAPLRAALVWFFNLIIFHDVAIVQIASCLILGAAIYALSLIPIKSKAV